MVSLKSFNSKGMAKGFFILLWWSVVAIAVIRLENSMWKEILAYSFVLPILFASYYGKVPGLILSILSSIVSGSQAMNEFLAFSPFAQRILFQILFINVVALVTTALSEREKAAKLSLQYLFNNVPIGLFRVQSNGSLVRFNPSFIEMLSIDENLNPNSYNLKDFFINTDEFIKLFNKVDRDRVVKNHQVMLMKKDGRSLWVQINCRVVENMDDFSELREYDGSVEDISERVELYEKVKDLATYDSLTKVFNRGQCILTADQLLEQSLHYRDPMTALLLDIDLLKEINDTYGHLAGDMAIKEVAGCIARNVRSNDVLGRYGGDEFVLFLTGQNYEKSLETAKRIREAIAALIIIQDGNKIAVTVSIGIATLDFDHDKSIDDLIRRADLSMYQDKTETRNMNK